MERSSEALGIRVIGHGGLEQLGEKRRCDLELYENGQEWRIE